jgi:peptidoglycan/LPS O-acetylase OafA/YrhL
MPSATPPRYQPQLDGIRAGAVLLVVAFHARGSLFPGGYIGVDIFFVLSGFLITGILLREMGQNGSISIRRFYIRRALRLLPALFLVCFVVGAVYIALPNISERRETLVGAVAALTYTASPLAASDHQLGSMLPTWSLSVEEYFYLIWPAFLIFAAWRGISLRTAIGVSLVIAIAYRFLAYAVFDWDIERIAYGADTRSEQILIGAALAACLPAAMRRTSPWIACAALAALAAFVLLPASMTGPLYRESGSTVIALLAAVVVAQVAFDPHGWLSRTMSWRPLVWVGQRSYGIYLWNLPLVAIVAYTSLAANVQLVVKLALTFAIPALSYRYLEKRFLRLKDRFEPRPSRDSSRSPRFGWGLGLTRERLPRVEPGREPSLSEARAAPPDAGTQLPPPSP